jgi:hypothetical protein
MQKILDQGRVCADSCACATFCMCISLRQLDQEYRFSIDFELTHLLCTCALFCWCDETGGSCVSESRGCRAGGQFPIET